MGVVRVCACARVRVWCACARVVGVGACVRVCVLCMSEGVLPGGGHRRACGGSKAVDERGGEAGVSGPPGSGVRSLHDVLAIPG